MDQELVGKKVEIWCECYIYTGTVVEIGDNHVLLDDAAVVYETGALNEPGFLDCQPLSRRWFIQLAKIESYGLAHL